MTAAPHRNEGFGLTAPQFNVFKTMLEISPEMAKELMAEFKSQRAHRRSLELLAVENENRVRLRSQWFGVLMVLICVPSAALLSYLGDKTTAAALGGFTMMWLVSAFLYSRTSDSRITKEASGPGKDMPSDNPLDPGDPTGT